ncbi:DUF3991 domain-containing protein [Anaerobiospirillum sp. NML120449]|uniref:DUF3991 domain-containing protein n=1 Tax=Anaerobiospirillum sp. NML120449 TaxID=2932817 RepID=UPI001FF4A971|nr:DUF3991 domain-containing protein [Anaerobiospirillum sp. NML120449]MCK0525381.1 DUF3991 domain-containing protein [Anaerobiospirillum sp. NML120449]
MTKLTQSQIDMANSTDPRRLIESLGYVCKGKEHAFNVYSSSSSKSELYRVDRNRNTGRYVFCDKHASRGGDIIKLIMELSNMKFPEVIKALCPDAITDKSALSEFVSKRAAESAVPKPALYPRIPMTREQDKVDGRKYLTDIRGISGKTLQIAEQQGFVRYIKGAVLFCGFDESGKVRNVAKRGYLNTDMNPKTNFANSDKQFAGLIKGDPKSVWVVEGGVDALALIDMAYMQGHPQHPTIIISNGAGEKKWIDTPHLSSIIRSAEKVTIVYDNEKDAQVEAGTNRAHQGQKEKIEALIQREVNTYRPPAKYGKDLADMNLCKKRGMAVSQTPQPTRTCSLERS